MRKLIGTLGRIVLVAVAAVLIGGSLAAPAEARQRPEATEANGFIDFCFSSGGDPIVTTYDDGQVIVACTNLPGTGTYVCSFVGTTRDCWIKAAPAPGSTLPTLDPNDLSTFEPVAAEPAPVSPPVATAPDDHQDDEQVAKPKPKKEAKKVKKGKKGKGNGKAKQRGKGRGGR